MSLIVGGFSRRARKMECKVIYRRFLVRYARLRAIDGDRFWRGIKENASACAGSRRAAIAPIIADASAITILCAYHSGWLLTLAQRVPAPHFRGE